MASKFRDTLRSWAAWRSRRRWTATGVGGEADDVEGNRFPGFRGAASATYGFAGEDELGSEAADFCLPVGFFVAGEVGQVGEVLADAGIFFFQFR